MPTATRWTRRSRSSSTEAGERRTALWSGRSRAPLEHGGRARLHSLPPAFADSMGPHFFWTNFVQGERRWPNARQEGVRSAPVAAARTMKELVTVEGALTQLNLPETVLKGMDRDKLNGAFEAIQKHIPDAPSQALPSTSSAKALGLPSLARNGASTVGRGRVGGRGPFFAERAHPPTSLRRPNPVSSATSTAVNEGLSGTSGAVDGTASSSGSSTRMDAAVFAAGRMDSRRGSPVADATMPGVTQKSRSADTSPVSRTASRRGSDTPRSGTSLDLRDVLDGGDARHGEHRATGASTLHVDGADDANDAAADERTRTPADPGSSAAHAAASVRVVSPRYRPVGAGVDMQPQLPNGRAAAEKLLKDFTKSVLPLEKVAPDSGKVAMVRGLMEKRGAKRDGVDYRAPAARRPVAGADSSMGSVVTTAADQNDTRRWLHNLMQTTASPPVVSPGDGRKPGRLGAERLKMFQGP